MSDRRSNGREWMPLWVTIPLVTGLWIASWISILDSTGSLFESQMTWFATAIATVLLATRLTRAFLHRA
jgi:hypothetical protein